MTGDRVVVVVDDSPSVRATIAFILENDGIDVRTAVNGRDGIELIRSVRPAAVLLDAMMPEMDGFEVCRRLRADPETADTPVIMLTTMGMEEDRDRAIESGVSVFLTKPFDADEVLRLLEQVFEE